jgi:hypothetical protein
VSADTLVLQAYGDPAVVRSARFCVATFQHFALRTPGRYRVVVYTDTPGPFSDLGTNVAVEPLDTPTLRRWRGAVDFVHRVKLELLLDFFAKSAAKALYVDSDTYFLADPARVFDRIDPRTAFMHECEGRLVERKNGIFRKTHRFVRNNTFTLSTGECVRIPETTEMWNAGVIGLHPDNGPLLRTALELTDAMYARYRKHVMEQLAVSYVLQTRLALLPADDVVYHYWQFRAQLDPVVAELFRAEAHASPGELADAAFALRPRGTPVVRRRPWYARLFG